MEPKTFLIWTCAIIFAATGTITIIGLIKRNFIQEKFLNRLFLSLILEIVAISVLAYKQSFEPQKQTWTITSEVHFLDENGNILTGDLRKPFSATEPFVLPKQIEGLTNIPYQITYHFSGDIDGISLFYTCNDSAGWEPAKINDLSKDSKDIKISKRDEDHKKLDLIVNIKRISRSTPPGINAVNEGPPTQ